MRRRLSAALTAALLGGALAATACAPPESAVAGSTWQITGLWTSPDAPGVMPDDAAGRARLVFGESTMVGSTGCSPLQGAVTFTREGEPARAENADLLRIDRVESEEPGEGCVGLSRHVHDSLTEMLSEGTVFDVRHDPNAKLVLTERTGLVDSPAIHLSAL